MSFQREPEGNKPASNRRMTCFLSTAVSDREAASAVRLVLTELGVDVRTLDDLQPGANIGAAVVEAVLSAAFVCVVLSDGPPLPAVMFEAGIATGSRRPVVIVASPSAADQLPVDLLSAPIIRYRKGSESLLADSLTAYVNNVQPIAAQLTVNWDSLVDKERELSRNPVMPRERSIIGQVAARLTQAGALVAIDSRIGRGRIDISATFPTLGAGFNPVMVEVKRYSSRIESDLQRIQRYIKDANARLGLVVYGEHSRNLERRMTGSTGILLLSADELIGWDNVRLIREITQLRNEVVHSAR